MNRTASLRTYWGGLLLAATALVWAGMVIGVSGLATPIKFEVQSLTLSVALEIGRVTFQLLNRVEWGFGLLLALLVMLARVPPWQMFLAFCVLVILMAQSYWLLPALKLRVAMIVAGETVPPAGYHRWFVISETAKIVLLLLLGLLAMRRLQRPRPAGS
ncbi:hypothetical protein [Rhodoligotrophos defluvii]|uniref:hypothetical protein n=1 Tax=Rhodoligotrophos defluvii TaxID=2561934 RepID=UPI0010C963BF|nr:hypothetical protein [Rhodoligotrophos defluvii]